MKYLLMACVERYDGTTYTQLVGYLTEDEKHNTVLINQKLDQFKKSLGKDYFVLHTWVE